MPMTPWVLRLIAVNAVMFFLSTLLPDLFPALMLVPVGVMARPWTLITYMFLHSGVWHLLFNMLGLYFFGPRIEEELGSRDFLLLYFLSGLSGAVFSFVTPYAAIVGASGAVYGVLLGFAYFWPRERLLIWGVFPVEARVLVIIMTALSLFGGFGGGDNIAHFAHLGGFAGGYLFLRMRRSRARAAAILQAKPSVSPSSADLRRWTRIDPARMHEVNRVEYERIQAKIRSAGVDGLTDSERVFLDRFSPDEGHEG